jgi:hypothetical protein
MACSHLLDNWKEWFSFAEQVVKVYGVSSKKGKIASSIVSLLGEPKLCCDAHFLRGFSHAYFHRYFKFLQGYDAHSKDHGYRSRNMAEFVFLALRDLDSLRCGKWKEHDDFQGAVLAILNLPKVPEGFEAIADSNGRQKYFVQEDVLTDYDGFLDMFRENYLKHFTRWADPQELGVIAFAGETKCAQSLTRWVFRGVLPDATAFCVSTSAMHDTSINLKEYVMFMGGATEGSREKWLAHWVTVTYQSGLNKMADDQDPHDLWTSSEASVVLVKQFAQHHFCL